MVRLISKVALVSGVWPLAEIAINAMSPSSNFLMGNELVFPKDMENRR